VNLLKNFRCFIAQLSVFAMLTLMETLLLDCLIRHQFFVADNSVLGNKENFIFKIFFVAFRLF
jgi:hypothetical protein